MAKRKSRKRSNAPQARKENQMPDYQGIPGTGTPGGIIMSPENIPHFYDSDGVLKVVAVGYDSAGSIPADDPAPENQAENYHRAIPFSWDEPQVKFDSSGVVTSAGFGPGDPRWYNVGDETGKPTGGTGSPTSRAAVLVMLNSVATFVKGKA